MDAELKATWIALLRSGQKQCFGRYIDADGGKCALGLLRYALEPSAWWALAVDPYIYQFMGCVMKWNDRERLTFPEIADRLEAMA